MQESDFICCLQTRLPVCPFVSCLTHSLEPVFFYLVHFGGILGNESSSVSTDLIFTSFNAIMFNFPFHLPRLSRLNLLVPFRILQNIFIDLLLHNLCRFYFYHLIDHIREIVIEHFHIHDGTTVNISS